MNGTDFRTLLEHISSASLARAKKYGVHLFEHGDGKYRGCPEEFIGHAIYRRLCSGAAWIDQSAR